MVENNGLDGRFHDVWEQINALASVTATGRRVGELEATVLAQRDLIDQLSSRIVQLERKTAHLATIPRRR